jgi:hypothetical protein
MQRPFTIRTIQRISILRERDWSATKDASDMTKEQGGEGRKKGGWKGGSKHEGESDGHQRQDEDTKGINLGQGRHDDKNADYLAAKNCERALFARALKCVVARQSSKLFC